jgi:alpha-amylase
VQTTGASGFRLDAIKHMDRRFLREFVCPPVSAQVRLSLTRGQLTRARRLEGKERLFAVAEYWSAECVCYLPAQACYL